MNSVDATPAKRFFVEMLIRDIELKDAILDLMDNCLDGAMRQRHQAHNQQEPKYQGYWARITLAREQFIIEDNCGGIPPTLAEKSAFRLGRHEEDTDKDLATVGVYGIGMKRAVFKMGHNATIDSNHKDGQFTVQIDRGWMEADSEWSIPVQEKTELAHEGVSIRISELREGVSRQLSDETGFVGDLKKEISNYYGYIISQGFEVYVNGELIPASHVELLTSGFEGSTINPYVYETEHDGIAVSVVVGFYRDLLAPDEEEELLSGKPSKERAGITVVCNDRVVIYADKTRLTGWESGTVPAYHTQFVSIAGVATFKSNDASKLPLTTTKRGLDASSDVYLAVREYIQEGLKQFTDFTNKWKNATPDRTVVGGGHILAARSIPETIPAEKWSSVQRGLGGRKFRPSLPLPANANPLRQIRFSRSKEEIRTVAEFLFDNPEANPSDVGAKCFDDVLRKVRE